MTTAADDRLFTVIAPLGRGGTAEVTRVRLADSGREAALKAPLPCDSQTDNDFATLARREYELIGGHRFPGLARLLEFPHRHPDYLLLELCEGPTVDAVGRVEDIQLSLNLISAMALSLEYLRVRGIVHGDLKPQNIFLPTNWDRKSPERLWYAKISDFSLGRTFDEPESARAGLGTVGYMAPEVIAQKTTSHQSDLFVLGVMAYQILTGRHPFLVGDCEPVKVNSRIQEETPTPIDQLRPDLAGHTIVPIVDSLLAKVATSRPKTAWSVCRSLREAGARYPYERAIRPRYLWNADATAEQIIETCTDLTTADRSQLLSFTGHDPKLLREVLSGNWSIGNLAYDEGTLQFKAGVRWPAFLRARQLRSFRVVSLSEKKQKITDAATFAEAADKTVTPRLVLIRQLLKSRTLRYTARRHGARLERNEEYVRATLTWLAAGDLEAAERCAMQAAAMLMKAERRAEALTLSNRIIDFARTTGRLHEVSELLLLSGTLLKDSGDTVGAESIYKELIDGLTRRPVGKALGIVYNKLGDLYKMRSDFDAGLEALEQALTIFEQLGDELEYSHTCNNLGNIYWLIGDFPNAIRQYRRALRIQRRLKSQIDIASTLSNLGGLLCISGRIPRGMFLLRRSLELKREIGHLGEIARTLNNLGYISYMSGDNSRAVEYLSESLEMNRRVGSRKEIVINIDNLSSIMIAAGRLSKSIGLLREGLALSREIGDTTQELLLHISMAGALYRLGKVGEARKVLSDVESMVGETDDPGAGVVRRCVAAEIEVVLGRSERAHQLVDEARAITSIDPFVRLKTMLLSARLSDAANFESEIDALIAQTQFSRLRVVFEVNSAERLMSLDKPGEALGVISLHLDAIAKLDDEIEAPRLNTVVSAVMLANGKLDEASAYCQRARALARRFGSVIDLLSVGVLAGQLQFKAGDYEQSFREYRQAIAVAKEIASSLHEPQDRIDFQNRREIRFMLGEIERLGLILGQKKAGRREPARA